MTIRARLTLWYSGILLVAMLLITGWTYYEMFVEHRAKDSAFLVLPQGESALEEVGEILLYGGLPAMLLALVGGWFLMRRALSPVTRLTQAVERMHSGNLHEQLPCRKEGDELDRLTHVFNEMTARLHDSFQRIREFTLHASHELKTPLTILQAALETDWKEESRNAGQKDRIGLQLEEVRRLTKIVDELTLLSKADAGLVSLRQEVVAFDELVREVHEDTLILAHPGNIIVELQRCDPALVLGDRNRLRQLLLNLCDNAVKYNQPGGRIRLSLQRDGVNAEVLIGNTGPGLSSDLQGRVFDRFFRGDPSRNHDIEGCGLGLSIAQCIAQLHQGSIQFQSDLGGETIVQLRLPLAPDQEAPPLQKVVAVSGPIRAARG